MSKNLIYVINENITVVDLHKFKCSHCGNVFDMTDGNQHCLNHECGKELFERMTKSAFTKAFEEALLALGIAPDKVAKFLKGEGSASQLGLCNGLSTVIDSNLHLKFGGQYKSFFVRESFVQIKNNNFE